MKAIKFDVTETEREIFVGYRDEAHVRVNKISFTVAMYYKDVQKTRDLAYPTIDDAITASQAMMNMRLAQI